MFAVLLVEHFLKYSHSGRHEEGKGEQSNAEDPSEDILLIFFFSGSDISLQKERHEIWRENMASKVSTQLNFHSSIWSALLRYPYI